MKFRSGESIVCINDNFKWARRQYKAHNLTFPVRGKCYVVRSYVVLGTHPALVLQGIVNIRVPYKDGVWREAGYWEERFEKAPSIDGLKEIARKAKITAPKELEEIGWEERRRW
jgi:hypothetical protein